MFIGGAGGQHGTAIASALGISRILVPRFSSILSAYGMALADVVVEAQEPSSSIIDTKLDADNSAPFSELRTLPNDHTPLLHSDTLDEQMGNPRPRKVGRTRIRVECDGVDDHEFGEFGNGRERRIESLDMVIGLPPPNQQRFKGRESEPLDTRYGFLGVDPQFL